MQLPSLKWSQVFCFQASCYATLLPPEVVCSRRPSGCVYSKFKNWHVFDRRGSHDFFSFIPNVYVSVSCLSCVWLMNMLRIINKKKTEENDTCHALIQLLWVSVCGHCKKKKNHKLWQFDTTVRNEARSVYKKCLLTACRELHAATLAGLFCFGLDFAAHRHTEMKENVCEACWKCTFYSQRHHFCSFHHVFSDVKVYKFLFSLSD